MGLQAITSRGLARGHKEGAWCPFTLAQSKGARTLAPGYLGFSPPLHNTLPFSVASTSGMSSWIQFGHGGKGDLPGKVQQLNMAMLPPTTGGPGNTGPAPPLCSPIFVLLVCFFNLTSAAVCPPIAIFPPSPQQLFPFLPWGGGHRS